MLFIEKYGDTEEKTTLLLFEEDPNTYRDSLVRVLTQLAGRDSAFAGQLQTLAQQANIQTGGEQNAVHITDSKIYGAVVGTNDGTLNSTYTFNDGDSSDTKPG